MLKPLEASHSYSGRGDKRLLSLRKQDCQNGLQRLICTVDGSRELFAYTAGTVWFWEWSPPSSNLYLVYAEHVMIYQKKGEKR